MDHPAARAEMIAAQLVRRGVRSPTVLSAMQAVPRHLFIPESNRDLAYRDGPVAIGEGQTISQPYIVALMSEALQVSPGMKVLEVGTGSGYQTAILSALGARIYSIEIRPTLSALAASTLDLVGAGDAALHIGNGREGLPDLAPFDRIIVTAAPTEVPPALTSQLRLGGCLLIPVGAREQQTLLKIERTSAGLQTTPMIPVLFVPMTSD